jgi:hypothetical protein
MTATFTEFMSKFNGYHSTKVTRWREGQKFFNLLNEMNPKLANGIRGTSMDPFHRDEVGDEVWEFVGENWFVSKHHKEGEAWLPH